MAERWVCDQPNLRLNLSTQWPITPLMPPKHKEIAGHIEQIQGVDT